MDIISGMYELVKALFSTFADAISSYPFTTLLVFASLLYWMIQQSLVSLPTQWRHGKLPHFGARDAFFIAVWFIASTVLAHFVGAIFGFIVGALSVLLNVAGGAVEPFKSRPLPFTLILLLFSAIAVVIVLVGTRGKPTNQKSIAMLSLAFVVLILTYIATTIYAALVPISQSPPS